MVTGHKYSTDGTHRGDLFVEDGLLSMCRTLRETFFVNIVTEKHDRGAIRSYLAPGRHTTEHDGMGTARVANEDHPRKYGWIWRNVGGVFVRLKVGASRDDEQSRAEYPPDESVRRFQSKLAIRFARVSVCGGFW